MFNWHGLLSFVATTCADGFERWATEDVDRCRGRGKASRYAQHRGRRLASYQSFAFRISCLVATDLHLSSGVRSVVGRCNVRAMQGLNAANQRAACQRHFNPDIMSDISPACALRMCLKGRWRIHPRCVDYNPDTVAGGGVDHRRRLDLLVFAMPASL